MGAMAETPDRPLDGPRARPALPITAPAQQQAARARRRRAGPPDLRIEEIEEKHVPKDRNIFDK